MRGGLRAGGRATSSAGCAPWDLAAGALVATEAGAVVGGLHGAAASGELVLAAPPGLFGALHDLIAPLRPDRD